MSRERRVGRSEAATMTPEDKLLVDSLVAKVEARRKNGESLLTAFEAVWEEYLEAENKIIVDRILAEHARRNEEEQRKVRKAYENLRYSQFRDAILNRTAAAVSRPTEKRLTTTLGDLLEQKARRR